MKKEFEASWYNDRYKVGGHKQEYFKSPEKCVYYPIWDKLIKLLGKEDVILEVGCGAGQLARLIQDKGFNYTKGFDFSEEAIKLCRRFALKKNHHKFVIGDVYNKELYSSPHNTIICCEVLEHLGNDLSVFDNIEKGTKVIFTVPNFNSKSHVRYFATDEEIRERYKDKVDFKTISSTPLGKGNKLYLVNSIKK